MVEERTAARLLEQGRAAERRRDALLPGTPEHDLAASDCEAMRVAYQIHLDQHAEIARELGARESGD